jgi:hypothetical protein
MRPGGPERFRGRILQRLEMRRNIFAHAPEEERFYYQTLATEWPFQREAGCRFD